MIDLFGHKCKAPHSHRERFSVESDLSDGERVVVAREMQSIARKINGSDEDKANRIIAEAVRYSKCGQQALALGCPDCHSKYFVKILCRSRICERCGRIYRNKMRKQIEPLIKKSTAQKRKGYVLALLTLTVSSKRFGGEMPGRDDIKRFYKETSLFLRLNYGKFAGVVTKKNKIREDRKRFIGAGWLATMEVGSNNNNLHMHAIVYGPIRQWHRLKSTWEKITGDSHGVDIRPAWNPAQVTKYILKYITKPPMHDAYPDIAAYAINIKGSRRIRTGGIFYNRVKNLKSDSPACRCLYCNSRLIMDYEIDLEFVTDRIDLYAESRRIEKLYSGSRKPKLLPSSEVTEALDECRQLQLI